jgi:hypothetical protein
MLGELSATNSMSMSLHRPIPQPPPVVVSSSPVDVVVAGAIVVPLVVVVVVVGSMVVASLAVMPVVGVVEVRLVVEVGLVWLFGPPHTPASQRRLGPQSASAVQGWPDRKPPVKQALSESAQATKSGRAIIGSIGDDPRRVQRLHHLSRETG